MWVDGKTVVSELFTACLQLVKEIMEHSVQIHPERCVLVMGPQLAAAALSLSEGVPAALSYGMLINIGIHKMLDIQKNSNSSSNNERSHKHTLLVSAYELEPAFAANKIVETLREHGVYQQWLADLFGSLLSLPTTMQKQGGEGGVIEKLASLQEKGVLLVYTYYDTILDEGLGTTPVVLGEEESVRNWASQTPGILHVHGVFSKPDTVACDCVDYRRLVGETPGGHILKEVCHERSVIFVGFDGEFYDPFLPKFARTFLTAQRPPPLLLSAAPKVTTLDAFLSLRIAQLTELDKLIVATPPASHPLGEEGN